MRLKQIKLSGFKSFVDPTTVTFPSNLSGIVGPNGCGKSNIIDAVRWVMGESSAKHLRGESMADVIFNGSGTRKPSGHASIELHFDNRNGGFGGMYAQYAEIVIRRQVNLDGQSVYYLNGSVCRRRDITDIFLGTGLGPRSYAIIEQGMISRLIESKPEELRIYLEEAAGISKYKERRRETELRLQHTRDNLARLTDLLEELQKQLDHLSKQAAIAEKYQQLKTQEHTLRAELLALHANHLQQQLAECRHNITAYEQQLEKLNTEWQVVSTQREHYQQQQLEASDAMQVVQREFYQYNTELARLEQTLQHHRERYRQLQQEIVQIQRESEQLAEQISHEQAHSTALAQQISQLAPQMEGSQLAVQHAREQLQQVESSMHAWQSQWDQFNQIASKNTQQAHVEQTRIQHLEKHLLVIQERLTRLQAEQDKQTQLELPLDMQTLQQQLEQFSQAIVERQHHFADFQQQLQQQRLQNQQQQQLLDHARTELQALRGRYASLQALQEAALGKNVAPIVQWLQQYDLQNKPRLAEKLRVEKGWELAVETVLSQYLEAICIDDMQKVTPWMEDLNQSGLAFVDMQFSSSGVQQPLSLGSKLTAPDAIQHFLQHIYVAENIITAMAFIKQLPDHASVITQDGLWLGRGWLRVRSAADQKSGIIARERELTELQAEIQRKNHAVDALYQQLEKSQHSLHDLEAARDQLQKELSELSTRQAEVNAQLKVREAQIHQAHQRKAQLTHEIQECIQQQQREQLALQEAKQSWQLLTEMVTKDADHRALLQKQRDQERDSVLQARQQAQQCQQEAHQLATKLQILQTQHQASLQHCQRLFVQQQTLREKHQTIHEQLQSSQLPEKTLSEELNKLLAKQQQTEKILHYKRELLAGIDEQLRQADKQLQTLDVSRAQLRAHLEQARLQQESLSVRLHTLQEQLQTMGCVLQAVQQQLPSEATEAIWEEQLSKILLRIERLGPINLAAISERTAQSERKRYLDSQHEDLVTALTTLEEAIRKIDRETRARFKEIYEKVNALFQQLFPRIFGGGNAYLELTGEDLLQTGVHVIARPPGKRNSTIHLLSGGEKALTAIALVFAIFQLNPAPFCMLDEVDAPLDDANIGRFCALVKEMSQRIQFIFISHNKLAIEMAEHLLGVTMNEPGVSRLVAVDVNTAMEMAIA